MQVDIRDPGSIPELGRSPGGAHGNPLQYSCLENPMDRGALWATVHGVTQSWTRLEWLNTHAHRPMLLKSESLVTARVCLTSQTLTWLRPGAPQALAQSPGPCVSRHSVGPGPTAASSWRAPRHHQLTCSLLPPRVQHAGLAFRYYSFINNETKPQRSQWTWNQAGHGSIFDQKPNLPSPRSCTSSPPEMWDSSLLYKPQRLWYSVTATLKAVKHPVVFCLQVSSVWRVVILNIHSLF